MFKRHVFYTDGDEKDGSVLYHVIMYEDEDCENMSETECTTVVSVLIYTTNYR